MSCLWSIATIILLQCVIKVFSEPNKGHQNNNALHGDRHTGHQMNLRHRTHGRHIALKHTAAAGAQRETVPSPVQDFVLVSGSPLFHERSPASDSKANAPTDSVQEAKDQKVPQMTRGNKTAANQTLAKAQGQETLASKQEPNEQQKQESGGLTGTAERNGNSTQESTESSKPSPEFVQELAKKIKESLNIGKDEGKKENGTQSNTPAISLTLKTPGKTNASSGVVIGLENKPEASAEQGKPVGENASVQVVNISPSSQSTDLSSPGNDGNKGSETTTTTAADVKPEAQDKKPSNGNFPFNVPGVRNAGNGTVGNKGVDSNNQIAEKDKKLGLNEGLGPNCHWKTIKGANGALVTSVACSGEFHRPEVSKGGSDEAAKKPQPGDASKVGPKESSTQQPTAVNASVSETGKSNKEIQTQSDEEFEMEAVGTTNAFRKIHRALPIKLDPKLNLEAKKYAEKIAGMGSLQHDYDAVRQSDEGENLAMGCKEYGVPLTAKEAITNWYNEVCSYDFDRGEFSMSSGHFTQVVWADSHEFGIGKAAGYQNGMPCVFVVGRFKPSGNYKGEYRRNVFKGTFDPSYCDKLRDKKLL